MKQMGRILRIAFVALLLALTPGSALLAAAQTQEFESDFYTSELAGVDIEVSGEEYAITAAELQHYPNGEGEVVEIESSTGFSHAEVSFFDDSDTPEDTINVYLGSMETAADSFELIDQGKSGDYHYGIALINYEGLEIVYYVQVYEDLTGNVDLLEGFLGTADTYESLLATAQEDITVDGVGYMENVGASDLMALVNGGDSLADPGSDDATPSSLNSVTLAQSNTLISVGADFSFVGDPTSNPDAEAVRIEGPGTLSMVAVGETGATPVEALDEFQNGLQSSNPDLEVIDRDEGDDSAWRVLYVPKPDGTETFMLVVADTTSVPGFELVQAHELPADDVAGSIVEIQNQIAVNDEPVLADIDSDDIEAITADFLVDADPDVDTTPEATDDVDDDRSGNPRDGARLPGDPGDGDEGGEENSSEVNSTPETTQRPDNTTDTTLTLTDSSWEGGLYGHVIEWDFPTWYLDDENDANLVSDSNSGEDTILIYSDESSAVTWLFVSVYDADGPTAEEYYDYWQSPEFIAQFEESGIRTETEVIGSRTRGGNYAVVIRYISENGNEYTILRQATQLDDGNLLVVTLDAETADLGLMYELALDDVQIDGESIFTVFSLSQLERLLEN